jgi:pyruvate/2-oxoglutarate dehydrogenase complex dihydrolipoamide acyltransferase (E2) component
MAEGETINVDTIIGEFFDTEEELKNATAATYKSCAAATAVISVAQESAQTSTNMQVTSSYSNSRIIASPLAKKIAKDNHLDLTLVTGSGPGGRIVKKNVLAAIEHAITATAQIAPSVSQNATIQSERARIPFKGMRKTIAERMKQSLQTTAQLSSSWDSDISDLKAVRASFVAREAQFETKVSMNAFIIKAMCHAIKQVPIANACVEGNEIVVYNTVNMGIAISLEGKGEFDGSLMVGVLRNVELMGVVEIDIAMKALVNRIRSGNATTEDLTGSTITLSSTAGIAPAGTKTTPVLNTPNAVLIGTSTALDMPVVHQGEIAVRTMMPLSLTFDHCVLDGEPAARFMKALNDALENPELMLA